MEILIAMFLTIVRILYFIIQAMVIIGAVGIVLAIVGTAGIHYTRWLNKRNNEVVSDDGGDFEESRVPEIADKRLLHDHESEKIWRELDRLNDNKLLEDTKDL